MYTALVPWRHALLRGTKVLARVDADGRWDARGGRVEIRYRATDAKAYQASAANLVPVDGGGTLPDDACPPATPAPKRESGAKSKAARGGKSTGAFVQTPQPPGTVVAYADGACSGNPGPAGLGVVMLDGAERRELSEYLGVGTNNVAELTAILRAVEAMPDRSRPLRVFTDSSYSIGVLTKGWKAKANVELVASVRRALATLDDVELHYVPGHAGVALNERADLLARDAVRERTTTPWVQIATRALASASVTNE